MARAGGVYRLRTGLFEGLPDSIRVVRMFTQPLGEMTEEDASKEGSPPSRPSRRIGPAPTAPGTRGWVVEFEYAGRI